ncbi:Gfo/Idh/MocA family protein [Jatrophihabitans sp. YIM 134969]
MRTFVLVGTGWRARYFLRLAGALPHVRCVGVVSRSASVDLSAELGVPTFPDLAAAVESGRPDFAVVAVTWAANPDVVREAVAFGLPVLCETPPAPDLPGLRELWDDVGGSELVQVAEQYLLVPAHAARAAVLASGAIGDVTEVQVSSTHQYHAVSLMRGLLGVGFGPVTVRATRTTAPLVDPLTRDGWTDDDTPHAATTIHAVLDFGDDRSGVYDFTDNQWHNQLRFRRILARGTRGELMDDRVVRLLEPRTIVTTPIVRRQTGYDLDLDGFETDHITFGDLVAWRNPYLGNRWNDEDIAMATILAATGAWVAGEADPPYPLREACQDHAVALAVEEAADTDRAVTTAVEPWA